MRDLEFIDSFVPAGGEQAYSAVVLGAGLTWLDVYVAASVDRNLVGSCLSFKTRVVVASEFQNEGENFDLKWEGLN